MYLCTCKCKELLGPQRVKLVLSLIKIMKHGIVQFLLYAKLCIYTKNSLLIITLHEQQAHIFVQFSDLTKNWHFRTLITVNISIAQSPDPKTILNHSKCLW